MFVLNIKIMRGAMILNWISVEDKLPDSFQQVLVWREATGYGISWIDYGTCWFYDNLVEGIEVVAWMPLPEPPRMGEE